MTARRTRRTSSSLFPENITPAITSIQPGRVPWNMAVLAGMASWRLATGGGKRVVGGGRWVTEVPVYCGFPGRGIILWRIYAGVGVSGREKGGITRVLPAVDP